MQVKNKYFLIILVKIIAMIDLIDECSVDLIGIGYKVQKLDKYAIEVGRMFVDSEAKAKRLGFEKGDYYIINAPLIYDLDNDCHHYISKVFKKYFTKILDKLKLDKKNKFLLVGIGNPDILSDSLGKKVLDKIKINPFSENNNIFKIAPNIFLNTGISTYEIVSIIANSLDVDCVILIDSLASRSLSRIGISFQLNSIGITPGSAMHDKNKKIDSSTIGVPCISIGVPFMIFASDLVQDCSNNIILAPKDIHDNIDIASKIIADGIIEALDIKDNLYDF